MPELLNSLSILHDFLFAVPFANMLSVRVSYRFTVMLGCVLSTIGLGLSCFATTIYWLIVTYGIFGGKVYKVALFNHILDLLINHLLGTNSRSICFQGGGPGAILESRRSRVRATLWPSQFKETKCLIPTRS